MMAQFIIRDIALHADVLEAQLVDADSLFSLADFAHACGQSHDWVLQLVEHSIVVVQGEQPEQWQFAGQDLQRARRAFRLQRDFDASFSAVALMLELLDEVQDLRQQLLFYRG
jgi:chaperone modulatory protein CbpM